MDKWEKIQVHNMIVELLGIIAMIVCVVIGSLCDWNVIVKNNILIVVNDIDSFSLTILQIQASIGTLVIAIIALITGNISDSYMGISISDFYLNIKPWKLTQKILIFLLLGLSLLAVIFHSFGLYNMVFYTFICTLIGIIISILEIYSAFKGRNEQNLEIEAYIEYVLKTDKDFLYKLNLYENFVIDWEKELESQDKQSYEKYHQIFCRYIFALWNFESDESLAAIEKQCYNMSYCMLGSEGKTVKERGIEFVQDIYDVMWRIILTHIKEENKLLNQYKNEFTLFSEICNELISTIDELSVENVEKRLKLGNLIDFVLRVAIWFRYDDLENENSDDTKYKRYKYDFSSEVNELTSFAKYIGYYLSKQQNKNNIINQNVWALALSSWSLFSAYNIPEIRMDDFLKTKVATYFGYCYGLLVNGQENIVKQGLYLRGMKQIIKLDNRYQVLFYMMVHCYIYYLAEREDDDCIPNEVRKSAKNIWNDTEIRDAFLELLNALAEHEEWLEIDIPEKMSIFLHRYEFFPKYNSFKSMIIEYVISDFYIFLILFMSRQFFLPELLDRNIDDLKGFRYVCDGAAINTKKIFLSLYENIFVGKMTKKQMDEEVELMYDSLEKTVKKKQKERYVKLAKQAQETYKKNVNEEEICEKIKLGAKKYIEDKFAPILAESDEKNGIIKINLLNFSGDTSSIGKKNNLDGYYSYMSGNFFVGIEKFLYMRKNIVEKNRYEDFRDDGEFMEYLSANEFCLLLGSQRILRNQDYKLTSEYDRFLDKFETIFTPVAREGIALKRDSIQVCLHEINVSIHPSSIKETNAKYDREKGIYNYSILNGLSIDFDEDELREFLYNNCKVINVTAKISIQENSKPVGTVFTRKIRP